ncbi:MAG: hypothetical protein ABJC09_14665 [Terriglobia bacterium]
MCPRDLALALADQKLRGLTEFPESTIAFVVVTNLQNSPLLKHHRDILWKAFGLPIFEELRADDGRVIARECEVHNGLHVEDQSGFPANADFETAVCDCGSERPRLRGMPEPARGRAAMAYSG